MKPYWLCFQLWLLSAACAGSPQKLQPIVMLSSSEGATLKVEVEVVDTPEGRDLGLMRRATLGENAGMLFLFPKEDQLAFWMKNTLIPLDMIFVHSDMSILGVVENAEPLTLTNRRVEGLSQYVLEVNGGYAQKHGILAGARVRFENVPPIPKN